MKDVFRKLSRTACVRGTRRLSIFIFHPSSFTFHLLYMLQIYEKDFEYTRILPGKIKSEMGYADVDNEER